MLVLIPEGSCLTLRFLPTPSLTLVQREVPDGVVRLSLVIQICQLLKCHPSWEIEFHQVLLVRFLTIGVEKDDCLRIICLLTKHWIAIDIHVRLRVLFEKHSSGKLYQREGREGGRWRRVEGGGRGW